MNAIDAYIEKHSQFSEMLRALRKLFLQTTLEETVKWGIPTYTLRGKNVAGIAAFKHYCTIWFYQGALLKDREKQLINAQKGKTIAQRQWRFTATDTLNESLILAYLQEAIQNEALGLRIKPTKKSLVVPKELVLRLTEKGMQSKFEALKLTDRRIYCAYIGEAKRMTTKMSRLDKIIPMINAGIGLHDKYKNC